MSRAWLRRALLWAALALPAGAGALPVTVDAELAGLRVRLDVYAAEGPPRGAAILLHGFTRSRSTLGGHAQALAEAGVLALTPDTPTSFDFVRNAQALKSLVAQLREGGPFGPPLARVVLIGFSAGGLSTLLAADAPGVVGYVGLDPFDRTRPDGEMALGLQQAAGLKTEAWLLRAPPSRCNAQAVAAPWATRLPALRHDEVIEGASHCDFESPSDWICSLACGAADAQRQAHVRQRLLQAVLGWLPR
ncbi:MAG: alpha/beta fold hydrolase [Rubrivivax sp.]|nr:alpha/beta fold hydrolase [Rubrivivax sp.]